MRIIWFGHACFNIESQGIKIITDPYNSRIGFSLPRDLIADIVTISHSHNDHSEVSFINGNPVIIDQPGQANVKNIEFIGISSFHDENEGEKRGKNLIFKFVLEDMTICHLGDLGHILSQEQIIQIGKIDILMIPVGGTYTIDDKEACQIIESLKPKIILPMHYQTKDLRLSQTLLPLEAFLSTCPISCQKESILEIETINNVQKIIVLDRLN